MNNTHNSKSPVGSPDNSMVYATFGHINTFQLLENLSMSQQLKNKNDKGNKNSLNYRNLNAKYNKEEMIKLEEDLLKNISIRRMAPCILS